MIFILSILQIIHEIQKFEIQIYQLPYCDDDEDDDYKKQTADLKVGFGLKNLVMNTCTFYCDFHCVLALAEKYT